MPARTAPLLRLALAVSICAGLLGTCAAAAQARTLHLTATVAKDKATGTRHDQVDHTVTFRMRSGRRAVGQIKGPCASPGNFFQCIDLTGHIQGIGSNLSIYVKWACGTRRPGCTRDATGLVSLNGSTVGKVTFRTTTKGVLKVGNRFRVDIVLGNFCQPTEISPGVQLVPKGCV